MIDIAILRAMVAAGAPVEVILAAIEVAQSAEIARVQARRLADAERQRRHRASRNVTVTARDSDGQPVTPRDSCDTNLSYLPSLSSSSEAQKEERRKIRVRRGKHLLPDNWEPKASHYEKADRAFVERKAQDLRDWARSKAVMRADWDATFNGFLKPRESNGERKNGAGNGVMEAFDSLIDRAGGGEIERDSEILDITTGGFEGS